MIEEIRQKAVTDEIDYNFLMSCLSEYSNPRDKITRLLRNKAIIRVKKGLYIFGPKYAKGAYSREVLANLIYGPSYISLEYALSFYGMIPERVETVTSMTNKRNKFFKTPAGNFSYIYINPRAYPIGVVQMKFDDIRNVLIASREKAIADKVAMVKGISSTDGMAAYLLEDLRIDGPSLKALDIKLLKGLAGVYKKRSVSLLYETLDSRWSLPS